jgi:membrane protease YdiL (CAAX protease family)
VIQARLAAPRRAAWVTGLVLAAAFLRALVLPAGDLLSTSVFALALVGIIVVEGRPRSAEVRWGRGEALIAGVVVGGLLLLPAAAGPHSTRSLDGFWSWAAVAAFIATLEEVAIRGVLFQRWTEEAGSVVALAVTSLAFALIHLPRYGLSAMPLDFAVGLALGGLRLLSGRILPCVVAHVIADWGGWFWP